MGGRGLRRGIQSSPRALGSGKESINVYGHDAYHSPETLRAELDKLLKDYYDSDEMYFMDYVTQQVAQLTSVKQSNPGLYYIAHLQGFTDKPTVVSEAELDKLLETNNYYEFYRGVSKGGLINQYTEMFKYGDYFAGKGVYGDGTYAATIDDVKGDRIHAISEALFYGKGIIRFALPKNAKIFDYVDSDGKDNILKLNFEFERKFPNLAREFTSETSFFNNVGVKAAMLGYDAIRIHAKVSPSLNGYDDVSYWVILNRSKVIVQADPVKLK